MINNEALLFARMSMLTRLTQMAYGPPMESVKAQGRYARVKKVVLVDQIVVIEGLVKLLPPLDPGRWSRGSRYSQPI